MQDSLYQYKRYKKYCKCAINTDIIDVQIEKFKRKKISGINSEGRTPNLIVSLTTFPERIRDVYYAIFSLLNQTVKPDKLILWLAVEQFPDKEEDLPQYLLDFKDQGLTIKFTNDTKSYKKLIPSLKEYPNDIIVTADDDIYYPENWLEILYNEYLNNPNLIYSHRNYKIKIKNKKLLPFTKWKAFPNDNTQSFYNYPTTGGGILYPPHTLYKDVLNEDLFLKLAPLCDESWFWAMAVLNKTKIKIVKNSISDITLVNPLRNAAFGNETILGIKNRVEHKKQEQIDNLLNYYPEIIKILISEEDMSTDNNKTKSTNLTFLENVFSVRNEKNNKNNYKIITILWIKFKIKKNKYKETKQKIQKRYEKILKRLNKKYVKKEPIRVDFIVSENSKWGYQSLYDLFEQSKIFEPRILISILMNAHEGKDTTRKNTAENYNFFKSRGMRVEYLYKNGEYLDLKNYNSDIVFYDQLWELPEDYMPKAVSKYALTCFCPYAFAILKDQGIYFAWKRQFYLYKYFIEHKLVLDLYKQYDKYIAEKTCLITGYPKLDFYQQPLKQIHPAWKDPQKTKIIYAPHHSLDNRLLLATFDKNGKFIQDLAKSHPETTWIYKPHPRLKFALIKSGIMTEDEYDKYVEEWARIGTVYMQGDYLDIFRSSDAMITDCSSFLAEYLPSKKPLIRLINPKGMSLNKLGEKVVSGYYSAHNNKELLEFFNKVIIQKDDYKRAKREKLIEEIFDFNESSASKIYKFLLKSILTEQ